MTADCIWKGFSNCESLTVTRTSNPLHLALGTYPQMDLIKVLGPYGKRFLPPTPQSSQPSVIPNSGRRVQKPTPAPKEREAYHKKKNLAFSRDHERRFEDRLVDAGKRQKEKRAERIMENRIPSSDYPNVREPIPARTRSAKIDPTSETSEKEKPMSGARKEQLARWKREKEELTRQKMAIKKPPFKGGAGLPGQGQGKSMPGTASAVVPGQRPVSAGITGSRPGSAVNGRPATSRTGFATAQQPPGPLTERRVTRAMAATAKSTSVTTSKTVVNSALPTGTNRSKNTVISKPSPRDNLAAAVSSVSLATKKIHIQKQKGTLDFDSPVDVLLNIAKDAPINTEQPDIKCATVTVDVDVVVEPKEKRVPFKAQEDANRANANVTPPEPPKVNVNVTPVKPPTPVKAPPKKKKGMQFDAYYMEFNGVFIKTCSELMEYSKKWTGIPAEVPELPEEVIEDIQSTLGQAQLLMESKLPQFGELLYFYLSRHQDPGPVLPCDLHGWWDVATISIDKVKERFVKLQELSDNNWVKKLPKPIAVKRPAPATVVQNPEVLKEKPKPSAGLRAFLAGKRKNKMDVEDQSAAVAVVADEQVSQLILI